jgi:hypothetical protein
MLKGARVWAPTVLLAALIHSPCASADCVLPAPPSHIPDGSSASEQEMVSATRTLQQYNDDVNDYTKCLEFEQRRSLITSGDREALHNSAIATLAGVANRFNEQVRRFKARRT